MAIRPTKFAHVVYRTWRFDEMLRWYRTVFGARVQYQNPGLAFLTFDDEHHRFAIANMDAMAPEVPRDDKRSVIGVDHVAYTYGSLHDLFESYARLKGEGILPYWCIHHGFTVSMYYADPDGNQTEFQVDCFATAEESRRYMETSFDVNPLGVEFDPDAWLAKLRDGVPQSELLIRRADLPVSPLRSAAFPEGLEYPKFAKH